MKNPGTDCFETQKRFSIPLSPNIHLALNMEELRAVPDLLEEAFFSNNFKDFLKDKNIVRE